MTAAIAIKLLAVLVTAAIGYLAGRLRWLIIGAPGSDAARVLSNVAFYVFIPALLFRTTARVDFATMPWRTIAAYFVPVVAVMLAVYGWQKLRRPATPAVPAAPAAPSVRAMAVAFGNTVQLGIPLSTALYGEAGLAIHIPLISLHALIILTLLTVLAELDLARAAGRDGGARPSLGRTLATTARNTLIHPVVLPVLAGLVWNLAGLPLPAPLDELLATLGTAVVPLCLVLIGVSLSQYGVKGPAARRAGGHGRQACRAAGGRAGVAHLGLRPVGVPLAVLVMAAALPVGSNALLFAQRYATLEAEATAAIVASTVAFVVTAALWLAVLGAL